MQSARLPLRQVMDSNANTSPDPESTARRRSGRVVRVPDKFAPDASQAPSKRKRDNGDEGEDDDGEAENDVDENDVPELDDGISDDDQESDEEAVRSKKSKKSASQSKRARKPSAKKPKINGAQPAASNHTVTLPRMPKKSVRLDTTGKGTGLYGMSKHCTGFRALPIIVAS
jgi:cohesin complex subunit SA-1/2